MHKVKRDLECRAGLAGYAGRASRAGRAGWKLLIEIFYVYCVAFLTYCFLSNAS